MEYQLCKLVPITFEAADIISEWEYEPPFDAYSFKGRPNHYLKNQKSWGKEQFCMVLGNLVIAQVACQQLNDEVWVGWSLHPCLCGRGEGHFFIMRCLEELQRILGFPKGQSILLRVAKTNVRAVRTYQKAGFVCRETILDEIPYSNQPEPFWVMEKILK